MVAALQFPLEMQGYWDHHVDVAGYRFPPRHFRKPLGEPPAQRLHALELQQHNRTYQRAFV
jgi:hypothetical protein